MGASNTCAPQEPITAKNPPSIYLCCVTPAPVKPFFGCCEADQTTDANEIRIHERNIKRNISANRKLKDANGDMVPLAKMRTLDPDYIEQKKPSQVLAALKTPHENDLQRLAMGGSRVESSPYAPMSSASKKLYTDERQKQVRHEEYDQLGRALASQSGATNHQEYQHQTKSSLPHFKDRDLLDSPNMIQTTTEDRARGSEKPITNFDAYSVRSNELFEEGKDDILFEGELYKFKPGLTVNFIPRYV